MITKIALIAMLGLGALATISAIGEERKPLTKTTAAITILLDVLFIIGLLLNY